ncbi:hypothetical protein [Pedobacter sp. ASV12]|uniref:hypothetical protein n=1 Tax=Pedobacter sp. ASV12 TaxID=2795120 RepID=UPI0018EB954B|nr:hypothetical protein [Pedobacter sp. ASV12]
MKKLAVMLSVALLVACSNKKATENTSSSTIFIEQKVNEFIAENPDWTKDQATQDATTDKFKHWAINLSNEPDFLKDMPLKLKSLTDTLVSGQTFKLATFVGYNDNARPKGSLLNYIQLQINGIMPDDIVKTVTLDKNYTLTGNLYKQGKRADVKFVKVADFKGYDIGKYTFSITAVKPM